MGRIHTSCLVLWQPFFELSKCIREIAGCQWHEWRLSGWSTDSTRLSTSSWPRGCPGRGRGAGRGQTATPWSTTLIDPPDIRYRRAANVGVVDSEQRRLFSPLQLFSLFFTEYILRDIVEQTNLYAQQCMAKPPRRGDAHLPWSALTVPELRTWIGMIFAMGVVQKVGRLAEYWSRHFYTSTPSFWQTMPCSRFMLNLRYLHFVDSEDATTDRGLRTWKVRHCLR